MFAFFDTIISIISSVIDFIVGSVRMLVHIFSLSLDGLLYIQFVFAYLPLFVLPFFISILVIGVAKFILSLGSK